mmetsp:Transcript_42067/g.72880  ORF Transcript_42067/g.72880 Transcript_42067/m.72880 type:complete len:310 (-) Transcript_42067:24-953(-)
MPEYAYNPEFEKDEEIDREDIFPKGSAPAMVSVSSDKTMRVWDLKSGVCKRVLVGHEKSIQSVSVDWDDKKKLMALTASADHTLMKWDTKRVLTSSYDKTIKLWDIDEATCMQTLRGHEGPACCADPDWSTGRVVSGEEDVDARLWDMETGKTVMMLQGHTGPVWTASINGESMRALTGSGDRTLKMWDLRSGSSDRTIILWDLDVGDQVTKYDLHCGSVWSLSVDWIGHRMVSGAGPCDNGIRLWDFDGGEHGPYCEKLMEEHEGTVWGLSVDWAVCFWEPPPPSDDEEEVKPSLADAVADAGLTGLA